MRRVVLSLALLALSFGAAQAETLTAASGYKLTYDVYAPEGDAQPLALVFLHGKNGAQGTPPMRDFGQGFARAGIAVYMPLMPWSRRWNGTAADAASALDALVDVAAKARDGSPRKVIVGGQSMGASFAMGWRADAPHPAVVAKLYTSPGHLLDLLPPTGDFWKSVGPNVEKARQLVEAGKGGEMARFGGTNASGTQMIEENYEMRAEVYLSFHSPRVYPSVRDGLRKTNVPVYWAVGLRDPVGNARKPTFDIMPANPASVYVEMAGDHNSIMRDALPPMIEWVKARAAR